MLWEKQTMKTFFFNFEKGLDEKYINWTKEAVQDFINLFPEYKDNFAIKEGNLPYKNIDTLETIVEMNKNVYQKRGDVFDEQSFWQMFDRLPDGSYKASLQKQIALASRGGMVDIQKLSCLQSDSAGNQYSASTPILINVTKQRAHGNIRGISTELGINISAGTCAALGYQGEDLKAYFKDIVIHELGHTFNATHEGRQNTVNNLGMHCTDKNCLMYEYAYTDESFNRRKKLKEPFCQDCMASMRDYMQNVLSFERKNPNHITLDDEENQATTPATSNTDTSFKTDLRAMFKISALRQNARYDEDAQAAHYVATITHTDGCVDKITATNKTTIALTAKDRDGNPKIPDMQRFRDIVAYAKKQNLPIKFGNIKAPEFKACLMIACLEADPPVQMIGAPEMNNEFLQKLAPEMQNKLKNTVDGLKNKQQLPQQPYKQPKIVLQQETNGR